MHIRRAYSLIWNVKLCEILHIKKISTRARCEELVRHKLKSA